LPSVKRDYYEILGVQRGATDQEIKSAYRKLALQFHPDRNPNNPDAEEKFKECSEAYAVLADSEKREMYNRFGHAGVGAAAPGGGFDASVFQDFGDIFGEFFGFGDLFGGGRSGGRTRAQRGADLREDITIEFEEAAFGTEKNRLPTESMSFAKSVTAREARRAKPLPVAAPAADAGRSGISRDFSALRALVPHATGQAA